MKIKPTAPNSPEGRVRLQKLIAECGLASRREAEKWIEEGRVTVNNDVAHLGQTVDPLNDTVRVDNKILKAEDASAPTIVLALNKPKGYICSQSVFADQHTLFELIPPQFAKGRLLYAGRLDKNTEGLIILTNDGALAQALTHPSNQIVKKYRVTLSKPFDKNLIPVLLRGKRVEGEHLKFLKVIPAKIGDNKEYRVEVHLNQGRKREIRRMFEAFGYFVDKLERFQIGGFILKSIPRGHVKLLSAADIEALLKRTTL